MIARRGEFAEASTLAHEAVAIAAATDNIVLHADALMDLAAVLRANGEDTEAAIALDQSAALYDEKGYGFCADRARDARASLATAT